MLSDSHSHFKHACIRACTIRCSCPLLYEHDYAASMLDNIHSVLSSVRCCWPQVFLNGMWVGIHRNPIELVRTLRSLRRAVSWQGFDSARGLSEGLTVQGGWEVW